MTILDLIKQSAVTLNITDILDIEESLDPSYGVEDAVVESNFAFKRLYEMAKVVIKEVGSYAHKVNVVQRQSKNKQISVKDLIGLTKIISIKNSQGYVKYSLIDNVINVDNDDLYTIEFEKTLHVGNYLEELELYDGKVAEDVYLFGLNSYYCLAVGLFEEYKLYYKRYQERLNKIKNLKLFAMPCRSWHE